MNSSNVYKFAPSYSEYWIYALILSGIAMWSRNGTCILRCFVINWIMLYLCELNLKFSWIVTYARWSFVRCFPFYQQRRYSIIQHVLRTICLSATIVGDFNLINIWTPPPPPHFKFFNLSVFPSCFLDFNNYHIQCG